MEQSLTAQTWKVTLPKSFGSGSANVAVSAGVAEFRRAVFAGETRVGVEGAASAVLLVTAMPEAVAAGLPVGVAVSRTTAPLPGLV
ncbi:MAG TPA: hypothetical protein VFA30_00575 [Gaiellaceae bacterium]|nr:hypothetical protein [Gaiellaceae bacterium]